MGGGLSTDQPKLITQVFLRLFEECLLGVSWVFQRCFENILRKSQEWFKGIGKEASNLFQASFKIDSGRFQRYVNSVTLFVPGIFNGVSRKFLLLQSCHSSYQSRRSPCLSYWAKWNSEISTKALSNNKYLSRLAAKHNSTVNNVQSQQSWCQQVRSGCQDKDEWN